MHLSLLGWRLHPLKGRRWPAVHSPNRGCTGAPCGSTKPLSPTQDSKQKVTWTFSKGDQGEEHTVVLVFSFTTGKAELFADGVLITHTSEVDWCATRVHPAKPSVGTAFPPKQTSATLPSMALDLTLSGGVTWSCKFQLDGLDLQAVVP